MANKPVRKREPQLNPTTRLVDKVVTMKLPVSYESTILHEYLTYSQGTMLAMFERLGGLLRMLSKDAKLTESVQSWQKLNMAICEKQLADITSRREVLVLGMDIDVPELNTPDNYNVDFVASHPIVHQMIKIIKDVSNELRENETLYMAGIVDDADYESIKAQAVTVLSGVVDRIAKATYPGKRKGGGYNPAQLAKYIRDGNKLEFADVPSSVRDVIADYELSDSSQALAQSSQKETVVESSKVEPVTQGPALARSTVEGAVDESNKVEPVATDVENKSNVAGATSKTKKPTKSTKTTKAKEEEAA